MSSCGHRQPPISIAVQAHCLRMAQPESTVRFTGRSGLVWRGRAQPTALSDVYRLQIAYDLGDLPRTKVLDTQLKRREDQQIPHMYGQESLCLFNPQKCEWNARMQIASTVLPLACLWLYFYEIWLVTGEWHGGGDHPEPAASSIK
jgi:hypothetical protein